MILIITHRQDFTTDFIIDKLNSKGIKYFRLNCEDIDKYSYSFSKEGNFYFNIVDKNQFESVWFRRTMFPDIKNLSKEEHIYILGDYETLFENMFQLIDSKKWLSHPNDVYRSENKIYQLNIAQKIDFKIPKTLITNDIHKLRAFFTLCDRQVIVKPIRQGRIQSSQGLKSIFTNLITESQLDSIGNFELTPCIYQEHVKKEYEIRVTVVENQVFSAKVNSQIKSETSVDWRKEKLPFEKYNLPPEIANKCVKLVQQLNLKFGAIDLIKNTDGEYIFLEINPNGQWAWIEIETGLKISDAIIDFLTGNNNL